MFYNCSGLTSVDLSNFDTSKVVDMSYIFYDCAALTTIKGVIDMKSCTNCSYMFEGCHKLTGVKFKNIPYTGDWWKTVGFDSESQFTIVS